MFGTARTFIPTSGRAPKHLLCHKYKKSQTFGSQDYRLIIKARFKHLIKCSAELLAMPFYFPYSTISLYKINIFRMIKGISILHFCFRVFRNYSLVMRKHSERRLKPMEILMLRALNICVLNGETLRLSSYASILSFEVNFCHE